MSLCPFLWDRVEFQLDPKGKDTETPIANVSNTSPSQVSELVGDKGVDVKGVTKDPSPAEDDSQLEPEETVKPKIKIGSGKPKRRKSAKVMSSSESDTPRYSMRIRPTPRHLSTGGRNLRAQHAVNYQENYDYRTGRSRDKPKNVTVPPAALSAQTAARLAAQAAIKDPTLLGTTPTQTIPVLILHNKAAEDSDNTIVYNEEEAEGSLPPTPPPTDPNVENEEPDESGTKDKNIPKPKWKVKGSLKVKRYIIRRPKHKKKDQKV